MKKEDLAGVFVYILIMGFAVLFGLTFLSTHTNESYIFHHFGNFGYMGFYLLSIVLGLVFNAILYELGHIAGAKVGGYKVESVNILGLQFSKVDGKTHFKRNSFNGLTGETIISPKDDFKDRKGNKKIPSPYGYLWFGTLFIAIELFITVTLYAVSQTGDKTSLFADFGYFAITIGMVGLMIMIYNVLPFKLDTLTDGYRLTLVSNKKNKDAFNELLKVKQAIYDGEEVEIKTFTEITNFTADLNLNKVYQLLNKKEYAEAEKLIDLIIAAENDISEKVFIRAHAQKIYIILMTKSLEESQAYYTKMPVSLRKDIADDVSMPSIRAYILMSGILDKSKSECMIALGNVLKAYKRTPKARQEFEVQLFNEALKRVDEAHPKWGLSDYYLTSK